MKGSLSPRHLTGYLHSRIVVVLLGLGLADPAHLLKGHDALPHLLVLAVEILDHLVLMTNDAVQLLVESNAKVGDGEVGGTCKGDDGNDCVEINIHVFSIPRGLGLSSRKQKIEGAGVAPTYSRL